MFESPPNGPVSSEKHINRIPMNNSIACGLATMVCQSKYCAQAFDIRPPGKSGNHGSPAQPRQWTVVGAIAIGVRRYIRSSVDRIGIRGDGALCPKYPHIPRTRHPAISNWSSRSARAAPDEKNLRGPTEIPATPVMATAPHILRGQHQFRLDFRKVGLTASSSGGAFGAKNIGIIREFLSILNSGGRSPTLECDVFFSRLFLGESFQRVFGFSSARYWPPA